MIMDSLCVYFSLTYLIIFADQAHAMEVAMSCVLPATNHWYDERKQRNVNVCRT